MFPVFHAQAWNVAEVRFIVRYQYRLNAQRVPRDHPVEIASFGPTALRENPAVILRSGSCKIQHRNVCQHLGQARLPHNRFVQPFE